MIPVERHDEPEGFDTACRQPGKKWLADNQDADAHRNPLWGVYLDDLRQEFNSRCGFSAMWIPSGTVDHWISIRSDRKLAYEWSNYRFVDGVVNSAKKPQWEGKLLDPFEVKDGWFEILLPSLQLVVADIPDAEVRARAEFTLEKLHLRDGEDLIRQRQAWMEMYDARELSLAGLRRRAPLLAHAVEKREAAMAGHA